MYIKPLGTSGMETAVFPAKEARFIPMKSVRQEKGIGAKLSPMPLIKGFENEKKVKRKFINPDFTTKKIDFTETKNLFTTAASIQDFIPSDHSARLINEATNSIQISVMTYQFSSSVDKIFSQRILLRILFYSFCKGLLSSRKIAAACESDTVYMYLAEMEMPSFCRIQQFKNGNMDFLQKALMQIAKSCMQLGISKLGILDFSGTVNNCQKKEAVGRLAKAIEAIIRNAEQVDKKENLLYGDRRGDEWPASHPKQILKEKIRSLTCA